ncbi:MAG: acyl-CoA reductase [Bacteroidota bacterium]
MNLTERIDWAVQLGSYLRSEDPEWLEARDQAHRSNPWFIPPFIDQAIDQIASAYLDRDHLIRWAADESVPDQVENPMTVGIVMAGNLPLVGFHDWLCTFISGHHARIKLSGQDAVFFQHIQKTLIAWNSQLAPYVQLAERLTGSDAYIATGSDNTARYFEYYFGKFPHIIRKNRTSVAVLDGQESPADLEKLSEDIYTYFGRGCRNITHLLAPRNYDFQPLLQSGQAFQYLSDFHKYKNNYDYQLAICLLNKEFYMTNGIALLVERPSVFAPISMVHYSYYDNREEVDRWMHDHSDQLQCRLGSFGQPFGTVQQPALHDYADGVNTLQFLGSLQPVS